MVHFLASAWIIFHGLSVCIRSYIYRGLFSRSKLYRRNGRCLLLLLLCYYGTIFPIGKTMRWWQSWFRPILRFRIPWEHRKRLPRNEWNTNALRDLSCDYLIGIRLVHSRHECNKVQLCITSFGDNSLKNTMCLVLLDHVKMGNLHSITDIRICSGNLRNSYL